MYHFSDPCIFSLTYESFVTLDKSRTLKSLYVGEVAVSLICLFGVYTYLPTYLPTYLGRYNLSRVSLILCGRNYGKMFCSIGPWMEVPVRAEGCL